MRIQNDPSESFTIQSSSAVLPELFTAESAEGRGENANEIKNPIRGSLFTSPYFSAPLCDLRGEPGFFYRGERGEKEFEMTLADFIRGSSGLSFIIRRG